MPAWTLSHDQLSVMLWTVAHLQDSSVQAILQARILEWVTIPFSRESFRPKNQTGVSCIAAEFFTV